MNDTETCACCGRVYEPHTTFVVVGYKVKRAKKCPRCHLSGCGMVKGVLTASKFCRETRPAKEA